MKSGNLNFLEPSGPLQVCNGTALLFYLHVMMLYNIMGMSHLKAEHMPVVMHNKTSGLRTVFFICHTLRGATLSVAKLKEFYCSRITCY